MSLISYDNKKLKYNNKNLIMQKTNYYFTTLSKVCKLPSVQTAEKVVFVVRNAITNVQSLTNLGKQQAKNFGLDLSQLSNNFNVINYYFINNLLCNTQTLSFISEGFNKINKPFMHNNLSFNDMNIDSEYLLSLIMSTVNNGINIITTDNTTLLQNLVSYCTDNLITFDENKIINYLSGICLFSNDNEVSCIPITAMISGYIGKIV